MIQSSLGQWWNRAERTVAELTCGKSSGMFATTVLLMRPETAGFNFWDAPTRFQQAFTASAATPPRPSRMSLAMGRAEQTMARRNPGECR